MSINTIIVLFLLAATSSARVVQFFRRDYTHFKQVNSFYKLHVFSAAGSDFTEAFQVCHEESSQLFYPKTREELTVVANLSAKFNLNDSDLLVAIRDEFSFGEFVTVDGKSVELNAPLPLANLEEVKTNDEYSAVTPKIDTLTPSLEAQADKHCVLWNIDTGTYKLDYCKVGYTRPFVCRKIDQPEPCPTIDKGYEYERSLNKCYKLHPQEKSWQDASKACYMEGARLLVLDDEVEFKVTRQRFHDEVRVTQFYIGIHRISGDLYTVNGERLDENGPYEIWYDSVQDKTEDCVTVKDNFFLTCACDWYYPFICEMNAY
ncbi:C-type mannose receptor 2 [Plutella xylostella]|uniref:C-type mannose receptor 2 n=1 Tax=Plutella xylostella TaxID=51655 RepID=UPI0020323BA8|nr:C-type mannose receptor 2 [Plutella xylostella]